MFIWLTCGLSLAIMVIVIILVAVFISKRRSKKFTINDEERVKQRLPPDSSIETGVEITDDSNQIYKELDEKYQHCKSFYKPLELNQGSQRQEQPIYEEVEPEYREIEPTYNELEPRCDIYEEVPYSVNSKTDSVLSESVQSTDIHKKTSPETFKYMFAEVSKD
ncbi:uncharacterized protein LOC130622336 [Hydractinia symbiolongicarpus]|uniref:uncharacterized protein LOC130622336 n=1 Tax=Hydractinia symbiolongicarpus TaxID=13093 RepID=UPI00254BD48C|nr:uncharacterized protein LOC130622336 [Hydractinia symbiolongicarpus]